MNLLLSEENGVLENGIPFSNVTLAELDALVEIGEKITESSKVENNLRPSKPIRA